MAQIPAATSYRCSNRFNIHGLRAKSTRFSCRECNRWLSTCCQDSCGPNGLRQVPICYTADTEPKRCYIVALTLTHCHSASCALTRPTRVTEPRRRFLLMADFHRLHRGHIGTAPKSAFKKKSHEHRKSDWATYVSTQLTAWETLHELWLTRFPGPLHIVFYEVLVRDTRHALQGILDFLNYNVTEADMNCAMANKEGIYRRKKKHQDFEPFTADMYKALDQVRNKVLNMVMDYKKRHHEPQTVD